VAASSISGSVTPPGDHLADDDVNIGDVELFKNVETPKGRRLGVFVTINERLGSQPYQKSDRGRGRVVAVTLANANAKDVEACPINPYLIQASLDFKSRIALPDGVEPSMAASRPKVHALGVLLHAFKRSGSSTC